MNGALVINKPAGKTSHDVVVQVRRLLGIRSIGHLGTLDPLATGVLPLLVGSTTRLQRFYSSRRKAYRGRIRFGFATDTYDADGHALSDDLAPDIRLEDLQPHIKVLTGRIQQVPPAYSAKKIKGVAAHELARRREKFTLEPVEVEVYRFDITGVEGSCAEFEVDCSSGTYIRSLAHDLGKALGCGAHLEEICRTASGEFTLEKAVTLEELEAAVKEDDLAQVMVPLAELLPDMPRAVVSPMLERKIRNGNRIELSESLIEAGQTEGTVDSREKKPLQLRVFDQTNQLIAIAEMAVPRVYKPVVVLAPAAQS
jgi:tRNA pseudouridine55 synthase